MSNNIDPKIEEIRDRHKEATEGPYIFKLFYNEYGMYGKDSKIISFGGRSGYEEFRGQEPGMDDESFLQNSWADIAYLLSEYDRLRENHDTAIKALEKAERFIGAMMEFYGEGLTVHNWHQNGDGEPWDNFFDNNMEGDELESIRTALSHLKG
ncbi:hypothetical protein DMN77_08175 [Paenibacillus sp. 79R4]|uniref:hypothetical protein n=1 Tax=Paenibacillus sp. 79R4 TaxID=2212847 RepID=UPI0015B8AB55|nr:hypothetical protein [Paenibacillus sp. 79R4]NWL87580.1 hypothetical protein [Paenibacillus sp. 79R4]